MRYNAKGGAASCVNTKRPLSRRSGISRKDDLVSDSTPNTTTESRVIHVSEMDRFPDAVYIGRANPRKGLKASRWQNPFRIGPDGDRLTVIERYARLIQQSPARMVAIEELRGKPLACWCRHDGEERTIDNACHGDVLIDLLEATS